MTLIDKTAVHFPAAILGRQSHARERQ